MVHKRDEYENNLFIQGVLFIVDLYKQTSMVKYF